MRRWLPGLLPVLLLLGCEGKREDNSQVMAQIHGERLTESKFELLLSTNSEERKKEILGDPAKKRENFENMLKQRLFALAAQEDGYGDNEALKNRLKLVDQRMITQYYYQTYLGVQKGQSLKDLESYYHQHGSAFLGDSGKPKAFDDVKQIVADSLIISKTNLDSFFLANQVKYQQRAECQVSVLQVKDAKTAEKVHAEIEKGLPFTDAVAKYSIHTSKSNQGKIGKAYRDEPLYELGAGIRTDSLFFIEGTKIGEGKIGKPFKKDSTWMIVRADSCKPQAIPAFADIRGQVIQDYLVYYNGRLNDSALSKLKSKYGVKMVDRNKPSNPEELKAYYEKNKDSYFSPETYDVYHIESAKRDLVDKKLKTIKDLAGFKELAAKVSENSWIKSDSGKAGKVKRDHCLPYGIGMLPGLWAAFDTLSAGSMAGPYQNPESGKWHWFFLEKKYPRQQKPFDRVKPLLALDYKNERIAQIKPTDTLAVYGDKVLLESDIISLRQEIPPNMQERYTREQLVDYLLTWDLTTMESEALGLTSSDKLMADRLLNVDSYWAGVYQDSVLARTYAQDTNELKSQFAKHKSTLTKDSNATDWGRFARDIAALGTLTEADFRLEYATNPERYVVDSTAIPFEKARFDLFQNLKGVGYVRAERALIERLKKRFDVKILDTTLLEPKIGNAQEAYKDAQNLHYDRKLDQASDLYLKLRDQFPKDTSLQDSICFGLAQIYIEQERYNQAMAEYRRVSFLYPDSPNEYKAEFMVGFIQSEHLKKDSAAVRTFEAMLKKYPKTDLSDDADWMIRNIRSGGKLMPVLEGDSGWVDPDSGQAK